MTDKNTHYTFKDNPVTNLFRRIGTTVSHIPYYLIGPIEFEMKELMYQSIIDELEENTNLSALQNELEKARGQYSIVNLVDLYEKIKSGDDFVDGNLLRMLEKKILIKIHPDKNLDNIKEAQEQTDRFNAIRQGPEFTEQCIIQHLKSEILDQEKETKIQVDKMVSALQEDKIKYQLETLEREQLQKQEINQLRQEFTEKIDLLIAEIEKNKRQDTVEEPVSKHSNPYSPTFFQLTTVTMQKDEEKSLVKKMQQTTGVLYDSDIKI